MKLHIRKQQISKLRRKNCVCKNIEKNTKRKAKQTVNTTLYELNVNRIKEIKDSPFFWIERTEDSTVDGTLACVEKHLGLI